MKRKPRLERLLRPEQIITLLKDFAPLLGAEVSLAVSDGAGRLLGSNRPFPPEVAHALVEAAQEVVEIVIISPGAAMPICVEEQRVGLILATGPLPPPAQTQAALAALKCPLEFLAGVASAKRAVAQETLDRYREINLLYKLGETLAACLDVDELLQRALSKASKIIKVGWGAVLLYGEAEELVVAASVGLTGKLETIISEGQALVELVEEVARTGKSEIVNDFVDGERRVPLLAVPLRTSERRLGVVLLADKAGGAIFTAGDEKLLSALAWQAAVALENARLFDNVRRQRDEIATMKDYVDNIFASIASGVITIDSRDVITSFNQAAETILRVPALWVVGRPYRQVLGFLCETPLPTLIEDVRQHRRTHISYEINPFLPQGEQLHLGLSLSTLRGSGGETLGVAIVMDDVTEKRRYERERALVRRYLPHELVDRLPHDLAELGLHGERRMITAFFADIRGFTKLSEVNPPEWVFEALNNYLTLAEAEVRSHQGIVDKYMGDAVMALFNTPLLEEKEHAWQAVQTAWTLKKEVEAHYHRISPGERLFVGIGICTGEAVVGNVGAEDRMEYTAIGTPVNLAFHLQRNAQAGQILLCRKTWEMVRDRVQTNPVRVVGVKGHQDSTIAYELVDLIAGE
ncbi:MAG: adenylate/guanylate cyclase domain-containing protein [Anaerolineae bacterium]